MKFAVLSDIHGNLPALKSVINSLSNQNIERYIIAGDFITDCPNPNEVIEVLKGLNSIVIRGNPENYVLEEIDKGSSSWCNYNQFKSLNWTIKELTSENIEWIKSLPENITIELESGFSIKVVHGSPNSDRELLKIGNPKIDEYLTLLQEDILICGHTHFPLTKKFNNKYLVNPGSVGVSFNKNLEANFTVLEVNKDGIKIENMSSIYEIEDLIASFKRRGLYNDNNVWEQLIVQSLVDGKNRNIEFLESIDNSNFPIPNDIWAEAWLSWKEKYSLIVDIT